MRFEMESCGTMDRPQPAAQPAAGGAALRKGGEAVQQAIGEISQKAAFRLKKRRPVGRRSFFSVWSDMGRFCGG